MNHSKTTPEEPACCKTQEVDLDTAAGDTEPETETEPECCSPSGRSCCSGN